MTGETPDDRVYCPRLSYTTTAIGLFHGGFEPQTVPIILMATPSGERSTVRLGLKRRFHDGTLRVTIPSPAAGVWIGATGADE